jgi:hypothetical protein
VLAQERRPFTGRAKGNAALSNGADEGSVGDLRGDGAGRGCVDITGGVTAGGSVGVGGRGGVSGVIPSNHAGSYSKSRSAPCGSRDKSSIGRG